jgi:hypothetical protein
VVEEDQDFQVRQFEQKLFQNLVRVYLEVLDQDAVEHVDKFKNKIFFKKKKEGVTKMNSQISNLNNEIFKRLCRYIIENEVYVSKTIDYNESYILNKKNLKAVINEYELNDIKQEIFEIYKEVLRDYYAN